MRVEATGVVVDIAGRRIVSDGIVRAEPGTMVGLLGPNGSGKTTLLRTVYRSLRPSAGHVMVGTEDTWKLTARAAARRTAAVLQDDVAEFEFTVREVVALGRVPHHGLLDRTTRSDDAIVAEAMDRVDVGALAERLVTTLSGGERQRVFLARALAQQTPVLVLDEPTNHLDIAAQIGLLELLSTLPVTVVAALHDLNLAAAYCDELYLMAEGALVTHGRVEDVLTPENIHRVYGVAAHCSVNPLTGRRSLTYAPAPTPARPSEVPAPC